jgi:hypothetical protein
VVVCRPRFLQEFAEQKGTLGQSSALHDGLGARVRRQKKQSHIGCI